jgi:hypothetical protein
VLVLIGAATLLFGAVPVGPVQAYARTPPKSTRAVREAARWLAASESVRVIHLDKL